MADIVEVIQNSKIESIDRHDVLILYYNNFDISLDDMLRVHNNVTNMFPQNKVITLPVACRLLTNQSWLKNKTIDELQALYDLIGQELEKRGKEYNE